MMAEADHELAEAEVLEAAAAPPLPPLCCHRCCHRRCHCRQQYHCRCLALAGTTAATTRGRQLCVL